VWLSSTVSVHTRWNQQFLAMLWTVLHPPSTPRTQQRHAGDPNVFTNHAGDTSGFGQWAVNPANGQWAARPTSSMPIHSHQVNALSFSACVYLCVRLCLCSTFKPRVSAYCCYLRALSCFLSVSHTRTYHVVEQGMLGFAGSMAPVPVTNPMHSSASAMPMSPRAVVNPIYSSGSAMPMSSPPTVQIQVRFQSHTMG